jgi:hypothetical protein
VLLIKTLSFDSLYLLVNAKKKKNKKVKGGCLAEENNRTKNNINFDCPLF